MTGNRVTRWAASVPVTDGVLWFDGSEQVPGPIPEAAVARLADRGVTYFGNLMLNLLPSTAGSDPVELEIEVWDEEPAPDLDDWQHASMLRLVLPGGVLYAGAGGAASAVQVPIAEPTTGEAGTRGWFAARLSGRGLDTRLWADPAAPESRWRLQLWPVTAASDPYPLKRWTQPPATASQPGRETGAVLLSRQSVRARMDYHAIVIEASPSPAGEDVLVQLTPSPERGIGTDGHLAMVISPLQWSPEMQVVTEVWDGEPPDDLDDWEEGFELGLQVAGGGFQIGHPTGPMTTIPVPDGDYAVRLYGRGFDEDGWESPDTPGDTWRLQLWPTDGRTPDQAARVKAWVEPPRPYVPPPDPEPAPSGPDLFQARAAMSARMGHHGVPQHVIDLLRPGVVWPGHPDHEGPG